VTKFSSRLAALLVGAVILLATQGHFSSVLARLTGTNPTGANADQFCVGKTSNEFCIDYLGDAIPTTTNDATLGTSSLYWNAAYITTMNAGSAGSTDSTGIGGTGAAQFTNSGLNVFGKVAITGVVASTTIPVNASYQTIMSTANGTVSITATPSIATTTVVGGATGLPSGTYLVLTSTGASGVILSDNGTLSGSQLELGAATRTITQYKTLVLIFDAVDSKWRELSFGNN